MKPELLALTPFVGSSPRGIEAVEWLREVRYAGRRIALIKQHPDGWILQLLKYPTAPGKLQEVIKQIRILAKAHHIDIAPNDYMTPPHPAKLRAMEAKRYGKRKRKEQADGPRIITPDDPEWLRDS